MRGVSRETDSQGSPLYGVPHCEHVTGAQVSHAKQERRRPLTKPESASQTDQIRNEPLTMGLGCTQSKPRRKIAVNGVSTFAMAIYMRMEVRNEVSSPVVEVECLD